MRPLSPLAHGVRGFSLVEVLVTTGVIGMVMVGLTVGVLALQRSFYASRDFAAAHADQVRVCDYLQRDGRSATEVEVSEDGRIVRMKTPKAAGGLIGLNLPGPLLSVLGGEAPPETKTVVYEFAGSEVIRNDGATRRTIASRLSRFTAERVGAHLRVNLAFRSTYGDRVGTEVAASKMAANVRLRTAAIP
jgi:prepilin-type N-terminal cleavage/methylation domain-containing protein